MKEGTRKPSTARKRRYGAPVHIRRKYVSAPLSPSLKAEHGVRSMPIIVDDTVTITKGDRKLSEGKILRVDVKNTRLYVEGITRSRQDGSTVQMPISPANVMITKLNLDDQWRRKILERKGFSAEEE
ncbi:50S ribosomal protein L24 [Candidatus Bathyarchaeota archaeon RBG_16_57_9]|nr:large subunit ribosomal protein L24 [uncultured archaeon]OGD45197.1 MAG: 50S ribosomal protein L24 [Candidatus Bathyarchaeota archaeon RBG_16_57_9]OGD54100.1 MAG: 50S ribosomal protein L24 [Candidatus Bathyarchaeota archaeon RBG_13_60_20]